MDLTALIKLVTSGGLPVEIAITVLILYIVITKIFEFNEYKAKRIHKSTRQTLKYVESILGNIKHDAINNMRGIMLDVRNGELTDFDKFELSATRLALSEALDIRTKAQIKEILYENGYYYKVKNKESISELIKQRTTELRNISADVVDNTVRESSPLYGKAETRFSYEASEKLFMMIVDKHVAEIDDEIDDINSKFKSLFGPIVTFYKYKHKGIDED